ncbi:MAG: hypothetical protein GY850_07815, partial [bacterium]|nr:hypothetical protein [bacterium]
MTNGFTGPIPMDSHARDLNFSRLDLIAMMGPPNPADFELGSMSKWMPESMTNALFAHL